MVVTPPEVWDPQTRIKETSRTQVLIKKINKNRNRVNSILCLSKVLSLAVFLRSLWKTDFLDIYLKIFLWVLPDVYFCLTLFFGLFQVMLGIVKRLQWLAECCSGPYKETTCNPLAQRGPILEKMRFFWKNQSYGNLRKSLIMNAGGLFWEKCVFSGKIRPLEIYGNP